VAASLLESLGLNELVADSAEGYFAVARALASDPKHLEVVKSKLTTDKIRNHPVFGASFSRRLETVFESISQCNISVSERGSQPVAQARMNAGINNTKNTENNNPPLQPILTLCRKGNYPQAELLLRDYLTQTAGDQSVQDTWRLIHAGYAINENFQLSEKIPNQSVNKKFILIKSWGYDFWSDAHHLASQMLLAELTHRIPIIWWGSNFVHDDGTGRENFTAYFDPINDTNINEIPVEATIYPLKWNRDNIFQENLNKWSGQYSRLAAQFIFTRSEDLVVSDFYSTLDSITPWIDRSSAYFGKSEDILYAEIFQKYFKINDRLLNQAHLFFDAYMEGKTWVAVHVPVPAKTDDITILRKNAEMVYPYIDLVLKKNPEMGIFLLTDSDEIVRSFQSRYVGKILTPNEQHTQSLIPAGQAPMIWKDAGDATVIASFLAAKCDIFLGRKDSNMSLAIYSLKNWASGCFHLAGESNIRSKNYSLHNWV
jgi:hypothetical protein